MKTLQLEAKLIAEVRQHGCWITALSKMSSKDLAKLCSLNCLPPRRLKQERISQLFVHYTTM